MSIIDHRHLPEDRLATNDEKGWRVYLFPAAVKGIWRDRRTIVQIVLIFIFLLLPWLKINGHQALLFDIPHRQFAIFGLTFWAHDTPILFLLVLLAVLGLAFVTAIWGRIWCGWACPQTVFIDGVFRRIEQWVIGTHLEQMKLAREPMSTQKLFKYSLKWGLFVLVGLIISHSFIAYFVGVDELPKMMAQNPTENWTTFLVMSFIAAVIIFDFGWFREQFCIIMCPYGRIQSVLMDSGSKAVMYDEKRGEPRGKPSDPKNGDCIDCFRCVTVCPTGIDIRRGIQMECIACTACIDVCDEVMTKLQKPHGLIRYSSEVEMKGKTRKVLTLRVFVYVLLLLFATGGLVYAVSSRAKIDVSILRGHDLPFTIEQDGVHEGMILNHYKLHVKNHLFKPIVVNYEIQTTDQMPTESESVVEHQNEVGQENEPVQHLELVSPINPIQLKPGELQRVPIFIRTTQDVIGESGSLKIKIHFYSKEDPTFHLSKEVFVIGPHK